MPGLVLFALLSLAVSYRTKSPVYLWPGLRVVARSPAVYIASCQKNARSANGEAVKSSVLICRLSFDGASVDGGLCLSFPALWAGLGVGKVTKCYCSRAVFDAPRIASKKNASFAIQQLQTRYFLLSSVYGISVKPSK